MPERGIVDARLLGESDQAPSRELKAEPRGERVEKDIQEVVPLVVCFELSAGGRCSPILRINDTATKSECCEYEYYRFPQHCGSYLQIASWNVAQQFRHPPRGESSPTATGENNLTTVRLVTQLSLSCEPGEDRAEGSVLAGRTADSLVHQLSYILAESVMISRA